MNHGLSRYKNRLGATFVSLAACRRGNFGLMLALTAPVLLGGMGVAVDIAQMMLARSEMASIADSASLSASNALTEQGKSEAEAKQLAKDVIASYAGDKNSFLSNAPVSTDVLINTSTDAQGGQVFDVAITVSQDFKLSPLMKIMGKDRAQVSVSTATRSSKGVKNSMSMFLVLDKSGSMLASTTKVKSTAVPCRRVNSSGNPYGQSQTPCYYSQIDVLKQASAGLFDTFKTNDKDKKYIRVGSVSYDSVSQTPSPLNWGTESSLAYINKLTGGGGTSSTTAFKAAYDRLAAASEDKAHKDKNGLVPKKYILFMTDGDNNNETDNKLTLTHCSNAKKDGITIYSVAFNAPTKAKIFLEQCATSTNTFYDAEKAEDLVAAFDAIGRATSGKVPIVTN